MATNPRSYTTNYDLRKWNDGDDPGAAALNANMDDIDSALNTLNTAIQQGSLDTGYTEVVLRVTQSGTNDPTVTVIKNTTDGTVTTSTYSDVGWYAIEFSDIIFTSNLTTRDMKTVFTTDEAQIIISGYVAWIATNSTLIINTCDDEYVPANGILNNYILEIRIYE